VYELGPEERESMRELYPRADANCNYLFSNDGKKLQAFMIGRQILITLLMFFLSQVCAIDGAVTSDVGEPVFGISAGAHKAFLETGLLGAIITTLLGSLVARVIATKFPMPFTNVAIMRPIINFCMALEFTGLTHCAWPLAWGLRFILGHSFGWHYDAHYINLFQQKKSGDHASAFEDVSMGQIPIDSIVQSDGGDDMKADD